MCLTASNLKVARQFPFPFPLSLKNHSTLNITTQLSLTGTFCNGEWKMENGKWRMCLTASNLKVARQFPFPFPLSLK